MTEEKNVEENFNKTISQEEQELAATKKPKETVNAEPVTPPQTEETPLPTNELTIPQAPQTPLQLHKHNKKG